MFFISQFVQLKWNLKIKGPQISTLPVVEVGFVVFQCAYLASVPSSVGVIDVGVWIIGMMYTVCAAVDWLCWLRCRWLANVYI